MTFETCGERNSHFVQPRNSKNVKESRCEDEEGDRGGVTTNQRAFEALKQHLLSACACDRWTEKSAAARAGNVAALQIRLTSSARQNRRMSQKGVDGRAGVDGGGDAFCKAEVKEECREGTRGRRPAAVRRKTHKARGRRGGRWRRLGGELQPLVPMLGPALPA